MTRFNPRIGAITLVTLGTAYLVLTLITGHSASSNPPVDLAARGAGLDVWQTLSLMAEHPGRVRLMDVRSREQFERFHLPGSRSLPGGSARDLVRAAAGISHAIVIVVAEKDEHAARLVGRARRLGGSARLHFLTDGARGWYMALRLPVPLFSEKPPPFGYARALHQVRAWLEDSKKVEPDRVRASIRTLASSAYRATLLSGKKKPKASGKRKTISGGCG